MEVLGYATVLYNCLSDSIPATVQPVSRHACFIIFLDPVPQQIFNFFHNQDG